MKWLLKIAGATLGALLLLLAAAALYIDRAGIPRYPVERVDFRAPATPERLARGKKLTTLTCAGCHMDPITRRLTGKRMVDAPPEFGVIYSSNITRSREKGIGAWSDGEIAFLLRTGVARDGRYLPPWMVKLPHMSEDDLAAIVAFLRSDDPLVAAAEIDAPGISQPSFLTKLLCRIAFKKLPYPSRPIVAPPPSDKAAHGRYLIAALDCYGCHSADFKTMNISEPEKTPGFLGGGNQLRDLRGRPIWSANLTPDETTGLGRWSEADLARALRQGFRPDRTPLRYPMSPMPELTDDEVSAIYAYLRTVPKVGNAVPRRHESSELARGASEGQTLYYKYSCVACHGDDGVGVADLRQAAAHFPTRDGLRAWIRDAPALRPGTRMPSWQGVIAEAEYDPLIAYVLELGGRRRE